MSCRGAAQRVGSPARALPPSLGCQLASSHPSFLSPAPPVAGREVSAPPFASVLPPCAFPQALLRVWDRAAPSGAISATSSPCRVKPSPCQSHEQVCPGLAAALLVALGSIQRIVGSAQPRVPMGLLKSGFLKACPLPFWGACLEFSLLVASRS